MEKPILHETIDFLSDEFTIDFVRKENKFYIKNVVKEQELSFRFFNGQDNNLIYETKLNILPGISFFCYLSNSNFSEIDGFNKFRVEVLSNNKTIHNEFIHIKY